MNAHNTNPMIEPIRTAIHFATLFMRLRLEMDALPRLTDMLLFVFIVRHFFASIDYRSFACSLTIWRADTKKGCSPSAEKYVRKMKYLPEPVEANTILCLEIFTSGEPR